MKNVKRGYVEKDLIEFGPKWQAKMNLAAEELNYLLNRGYPTKNASTFIGNHYLLSERQRLALARIVAPLDDLIRRKEKEITIPGNQPFYVDGFNTIITLEVALSGSLLIQGMDGTIRDLAGLRGTYRIVDKTKTAIELMLRELDALQIYSAVIYLDKPVSNSGRLKNYIMELQESYKVQIEIELILPVDRTLSKHGNVITTDAIILNECTSWFNLNKQIIENNIPDAWIYQLKERQL